MGFFFIFSSRFEKPIAHNFLGTYLPLTILTLPWIDNTDDEDDLKFSDFISG